MSTEFNSAGLCNCTCPSMGESVNGVTSSQTAVGPNVLQVDDFFEKASILHPLAIGTIAITCLFVYLRLSSNRCVAPVTLFDWLLNVAIGSTLAGIVNGTSLVRGLISLATLMAFQFLSSQISTHYGLFFERALNSPPLLIAFRGQPLHKVMRRHRISMSDLNLSLRSKGIWDITFVEAVIIEPTGAFSIYRTRDRPENASAGVLMDVPAYRKLVERFEKGGGKGDHEDGADNDNDDHNEGSQGERGGRRRGDEDGESERSVRPATLGSRTASVASVLFGRRKGEKERINEREAEEAAEVGGQA